MESRRLDPIRKGVQMKFQRKVVKILNLVAAEMAFHKRVDLSRKVALKFIVARMRSMAAVPMV